MPILPLTDSLFSITPVRSQVDLQIYLAHCTQQLYYHRAPLIIMVFFIPAAIGFGAMLATTQGLRTAAPLLAHGAKKYFSHHGRQFGGTFARSFPFGIGYASGTYTGFPGNYQDKRKAYKPGKQYNFRQKMPYRRYSRYSRYSRYPTRRRYSRFTSRRRYY